MIEIRANKTNEKDVVITVDGGDEDLVRSIQAALIYRSFTLTVVVGKKSPPVGSRIFHLTGDFGGLSA